jgi:hypothetical protein
MPPLIELHAAWLAVITPQDNPYAVELELRIAAAVSERATSGYSGSPHLTIGMSRAGSSRKAQTGRTPSPFERSQ